MGDIVKGDSMLFIPPKLVGFRFDRSVRQNAYFMSQSIDQHNWQQQQRQKKGSDSTFSNGLHNH